MGKETRTFEGDTNCSVLPLPSCFPHTTTSQEQELAQEELAQEGCGDMEVEADSG